VSKHFQLEVNQKSKLFIILAVLCRSV